MVGENGRNPEKPTQTPFGPPIWGDRDANSGPNSRRRTFRRLRHGAVLRGLNVPILQTMRCNVCAKDDCEYAAVMYLNASVQHVFKMFTLTAHTLFITVLYTVVHADELRMLQGHKKMTIFSRNSGTFSGGSSDRKTDSFSIPHM